jgi:FixJ family two-component response regulator
MLKIGGIVMAAVDGVVYVVDDDARVRDALSALLRANGKPVQAFESGKEFLATPKPDTAACLILDMRMPDMSGLEVQKLVTPESPISVVFITGRGDVPSTVLAMKGGAVDFLTKPIDEEALIAAVDAALLKAQLRLREMSDAAALRASYDTLTRREQELLPLLVQGLLNKQAAESLGITEYTVQIHRGRIMRKMRAGSFAELVRQAGKLGLDAGPPKSAEG